MAGEWPMVTVESIAEKVASGPFGSNLRGSEYVAAGVPVVRGGNLSGPRFNEQEYVYVTDAKAEQLSSSLAYPLDVVFAARGSVGAVGIVPQGRYPRFLLSSNLVKVTVDRKKADPSFVFYYFRSRHGQNMILAHVNTTGVPKIERALESLRGFTLPRLPVKEQQAIAYILGALDDKIDLNRRMNQTLDAIARAIFKSWFVDFDPVRAKAEGRDPDLPDHIASLFPDGFERSKPGQIPRGWRSGVMGDLCEIALGGAWGGDEPLDDAAEAVCLRGVDLEHLRNSGWADAPRRWFKPRRIEDRRVDERDVLVAASGVGPLGRSLWVSRALESAFDLPVIYSNFCKRLRCGSVARAVYLDRCLQLMREEGEIWSYATGTSIPNLDSKSLLDGKEIAVPPDPLLDSYLAFVHPVNRRLYSRESRSLTALRDTLLPKLMSGDLRVPDAERIVGRCV